MPKTKQIIIWKLKANHLHVKFNVHGLIVKGQRTGDFTQRRRLIHNAILNESVGLTGGGGGKGSCRNFTVLHQNNRKRTPVYANLNCLNGAKRLSRRPVEKLHIFGKSLQNNSSSESSAWIWSLINEPKIYHLYSYVM